MSPTLLPSLSVSLALSGKHAAAKHVHVKLTDQKRSVIREEKVKCNSSGTDDAVVNWDWENGEIKLWWPVNYGDQTLYTVEIQLEDAVCPKFNFPLDVTVPDTHISSFCRMEISLMPNLSESDFDALNSFKRSLPKLISMAKELLSCSESITYGCSWQVSVLSIYLFWSFKLENHISRLKLDSCG